MKEAALAARCYCRLGSATGSTCDGGPRCLYQWRGPHGAPRTRANVTPDVPLRVSLGDRLGALVRKGCP